MQSDNNIYRVTVNGFSFNLSRQEVEQADLSELSPGQFNLIHHDRSVSARIIDADNRSKNVKLEIDGETFSIDIKSELDVLLECMGFGVSAGKTLKEIKAPMPGLVLKMDVAIGQEVKQGDRLLILEAMKMENSIVATGNARIKNITVKDGQAVEKGQVLIELE